MYMIGCMCLVGQGRSLYVHDRLCLVGQGGSLYVHDRLCLVGQGGSQYVHDRLCLAVEYNIIAPIFFQKRCNHKYTGSLSQHT